jgi:hypothetical protein
MSGEKTDMGLLDLLHLRMSIGLCDLLGDLVLQVRPRLGRRCTVGIPELGWTSKMEKLLLCGQRTEGIRFCIGGSVGMRRTETQADVRVCTWPNVVPECSRPPGDWPRRGIRKWSRPRCFLPPWLCSWFQIHSRYSCLHDGVICSEGHRLSSRGGQDEGPGPCNRSRRNDKVREEPRGWCGRCVFVQPVAIWER